MHVFPLHAYSRYLDRHAALSCMVPELSREQFAKLHEELRQLTLALLDRDLKPGEELRLAQLEEALLECAASHAALEQLPGPTSHAKKNGVAERSPGEGLATLPTSSWELPDFVAELDGLEDLEEVEDDSIDDLCGESENCSSYTRRELWQRRHRRPR
jgi:hypothetical protein